LEQLKKIEKILVDDYSKAIKINKNDLGINFNLFLNFLSTSCLYFFILFLNILFKIFLVNIDSRICNVAIGKRFLF
jgi:hypothetical protein